jgi:2-methylcitrate dehydratase PrpD
MPQDLPLAVALGERFDSLAYRDLTEGHRDALYRSIVDVLACGYAGIGSRHHRAVTATVDGGQNATVLGADRMASTADAAFANATTAHVLTYDDRHRASSTHPGSIVVPTALAIGESVGASGQEVLLATFAGYETIGRLGKLRMGFNTDLPRRPTPVFTPIGAGVTAGLLYGLDPEELASTMGFAANLSGGMSQVWAEGTDEYALHAGFAARNGVLAARLADKGLVAAPHTFEGDFGFFRAFFGDVPDSLTNTAAPFDDGAELDDVYGKPVPACGMVVVPIQLAERLRTEGVTADRIDRLSMTVSGRTENIPGCSYYGPFDSPTRALMSIPFGVASTFVLDGYSWAGPSDHYDDDRIQALVDRIDLHYDDDFSKYRTEMVVDLDDGSTLSVEAAEPDPITDADVDAKFTDHASQVIGTSEADAVLAELRTLEDAVDVSPLVRGLGGTPG